MQNEQQHKSSECINGPKKKIETELKGKGRGADVQIPLPRGKSNEIQSWKV